MSLSRRLSDAACVEFAAYRDNGLFRHLAQVNLTGHRWGSLPLGGGQLHA